MNTVITPARARTDTRPAPRNESTPEAARRVLSGSGVRAAGLGITALALTHAVLFVAFIGDWHSPTSRMFIELAGYALQLAMLGVLLVMWRTRAVGDSIGWRLTGAIVTALTIAALGSSILHQLLPEADAVRTLANVFMLTALTGFYAVSIGVISQHRWRGFLRFVPIIGSSWGPAVVISVMLGSEEGSWWTFIIYLSVSAVINGLALVARPDLTQPRPTR